VTYNYHIYHWEIFDVTWDLGISFWTEEGERTATIFEDRVEEDAEAAGKLYIITCVPQPGCSERLRVCSIGKKARLDDFDCRRCGIWPLEFTTDTLPVYIYHQLMSITN
jgi:hypothetical protein